MDAVDLDSFSVLISLMGVDCMTDVVRPPYFFVANDA